MKYTKQILFTIELETYKYDTRKKNELLQFMNNIIVYFTNMILKLLSSAYV